MRGPAALSLLLMSGFLATSGVARAEAPVASGGRVNNLKVLSDKVDDVTTVENILKSFVRPGMTDQERARAIWTAVVKYRHQTAPPDEFLAADWEAHDPVKIFNVYGYCMCCCSSAADRGPEPRRRPRGAGPDPQRPQRPRGPLRRRPGTCSTPR